MESEPDGRPIVPSLIFVLWTIAALAAAVFLFVFLFTKGMVLGLVPVVLGAGFCFLPLFSKSWIPIVGTVLQSGLERAWLFSVAASAWLFAFPYCSFLRLCTVTCFITTEPQSCWQRVHGVEMIGGLLSSRPVNLAFTWDCWIRLHAAEKY